MTSVDEPTSADDPTPTEVERVPLKVVPIFVTPIEDEPEVPAEEPQLVEEPDARPRRPWVGLGAVALTLATIAVHVAALVVSTAGDFPTGTLLAYVATGVSAAAVVVGIVAAILGRGRAWGIAAALVAVLANPIVLLAILRFLSGLQTG